MPFSEDSVMPSGGMNKDMDFALVPQGDYLDALNVQHITKNGQTSYSIQNSLGNKLSFVIPPTVTQNKVYKILMQNASGTTRSIQIYDQNGLVLVSGSIVDWTDSTTVALTYSSFGTAISSYFYGSGQTYTLTLSGNYAIFTLTTITGLDYSVADIDYNTNPTAIYIIQEAWDASLAGPSNVIGSYDLLGQLFVFSTPQSNILTTYSSCVSNITNSSGKIEITTNINLNLTTGQSVTIFGTGTNADGTWIITVVDTTHFILQNSTYSTTASTGSISINQFGIGEIGVAVHDENTGVTSYTTLLKSKELNFRTSYQIDSYGEQNDYQTSLYYTDNLNQPRCFYYLNGPYVYNGAIAQISSSGIYNYGTISSQSQLILQNTNVQLSFTSQTQTSGAIVSGNWRYAIRLLTANLSPTNWTDLTNIIPVFSPSTSGSPSGIYGDYPEVSTGKVNNFTVTNIPVGAFAYVELAGVHYSDGSVSGTLINKFSITGSQMNISHTGTESGTTALDVATLIQVNTDIATARNIDAIDNRLILSNLTASQVTDFSAWAKTITHSIKANQISSIGSDFGHNTFGEYQDPLNVYNYMGYCMFETYRFTVKFRIRNSGLFTQNFWVDDITINDSVTNVTYPNRRVIGLPTVNLTTNSSNPFTAGSGNKNSAGVSSPLVPYVEFDGINFDALINGVPLRDLVSEIHFERVERTGRQSVLASGIIVMGYYFNGTGDCPYYHVGSTSYANGPNPFACIGFQSGLYGYQLYSGFPSTNVPGGIQNRKIMEFYSPDLFCGQQSINLINGDKLITLGNPEVDDYNNVLISGSTYTGDIAEYNAYYGSTPTYNSNSLTGAYLVTDQYNGYVGPTGGITWSNLVHGHASYQGGEKGGVVFITPNDVTNNSSNNDYGVYGAYYFRTYTYSDVSNPVTSGQYGDPALNTSVPTGAVLPVPLIATPPVFSLSVTNITSLTGSYILVDVSSTANLATGMTVSIVGSGGGTGANGIWQIVIVSSTRFYLANSAGTGYIYTSGGTVTPIYNIQTVFGGDVFTQKSYLMYRTGGAGAGNGAGLGFYSQNVVNSQLVFKGNSNDVDWNYPNVTNASNWVSVLNFTSQDAVYDAGFSYNNEVSSDTSFNASLPNQTQLPTRIIWSDLKPQNAVLDNYRIFLPLNYFDLPMNFGPITHHANFNGELFTWQPRMVQRQYFNTRGTMNVSDGSQVLIGDGSVLSRDGQMVTVIGTNNKWSVVKGKSAQGNETMYWINTELKQPMRMGYDGTIKIGNIHGMQSFFANNLKWVNGIDTPANGEGISGVWDDRYSCVLWTVIGRRQEANIWASTTIYTPNTVVYETGLSPNQQSTFNQTGEFYVANVQSQGYSPVNNLTQWTLIPHQTPADSVTVNGITYYAKDYYNEYTIEYNEDKNKFTTFHTFLPKIYLKWTDTFMTPSPVNTVTGILNNTGAIYEHRQGLAGYWYAGILNIATVIPNDTYGTVEITTSTNHGYATGDTVVVSGTPYNPNYNGTWKIIVTGATTFTLVGSVAFSYSASTIGFVSNLTQSNCTSDGYITLLFNKDVNLSKQYLALWVASLLAPARFDFYTRNHQSFLLSSDFENNLDYQTSYIKNDILTSSNGQNNNEDTSNLFGQYLEMKMTFTKGIFQKITDLVLKFFAQFRTYNK